MEMKRHIVKRSNTARVSLGILEKLGVAGSVLFVINENGQVVGTLTDGDIRRGLLKGLNPDDKVDNYMNNNFKYFNDSNFTKDLIKKYKVKKLRVIPYINSNKELIKIIVLGSIKTLLPLDVVFMAGGKGLRLLPLTENTPKPLLKVRDKPIIEYNIDRLITLGITNFNFTIQYLGDKIINYLGDGSDKEVSFKYIKEDKPLGTIGAVRLISNYKHDHILIMNADLLTAIDFETFYDTFIKTNSDMAVATVPYYVNIPYAVLEVNANKKVISLKEKPKYTYYSNAGIYLIKKEIINLIPKGVCFDATQLIDLVIKKKKKLISYPILEYWLDIGRQEDYYRAQEDMKYLKLNI